VVSASVAEALAARGDAGVALLDFRLPDGTGLEVAERLRDRNPTVRILLMSGYADDMRRRMPDCLAAVDQLEKPVDVERLLAWVARAVEHEKAARPRR
jgi:DNA-binding NtrC family response regulator